MPTKTILVVGGCGYIGSHMVAYLQASGYTALVLDNLSTGHQDAVPQAKLIIGDMNDSQLLDALFAEHTIDAVMHFASFIEVGESVKDPAKYYQNNVAATLTLLNAMKKAQVIRFIFSSTAAVYGEPRYPVIDESHPLAPINPYGRGKWMIEQILQDYSHAYGLQYAVLRYFNAAGAHPQGILAERHSPESHLIPLILQVAAGQRESITQYGNDYATKDGTCVRDYVHVTDLCQGHLLALQALQTEKRNMTYNMGSGQGYSVQQVIEAARRITEHAIPVVNGPRRPGDPARLVANADRIQAELNWQPQYSNLDTIIQHAWQASHSPVHS